MELDNGVNFKVWMADCRVADFHLRLMSIKYATNPQRHLHTKIAPISFMTDFHLHAAAVIYTTIQPSANKKITLCSAFACN